jgi:hypothetical protein
MFRNLHVCVAVSKHAHYFDVTYPFAVRASTAGTLAAQLVHSIKSIQTYFASTQVSPSESMCVCSGTSARIAQHTYSRSSDATHLYLVLPVQHAAC